MAVLKRVLLLPSYLLNNKTTSVYIAFIELAQQ